MGRSETIEAAKAKLRACSDDELQQGVIEINAALAKQPKVRVYQALTLLKECTIDVMAERVAFEAMLDGRFS